MKTIGKNFSPLVQICSIWIEHNVLLFLEAKFALCFALKKDMCEGKYLGLI